MLPAALGSIFKTSVTNFRYTDQPLALAPHLIAKAVLKGFTNWTFQREIVLFEF